MREEIKNKVREIQSKYCGEAVETKLYHAILEGIKIGKEDAPKLFDISFDADSFDYKGEYSRFD